MERGVLPVPFLNFFDDEIWDPPSSPIMVTRFTVLSISALLISSRISDNSLRASQPDTGRADPSEVAFLAHHVSPFDLRIWEFPGDFHNQSLRITVKIEGAPKQDKGTQWENEIPSLGSYSSTLDRTIAPPLKRALL